MMANWEKLNKEFDTILDSITDKEWDNWLEGISKQKELEKMQMLLEANMQSEKLLFDKLMGNIIVNQTLVSESVVDLSKLKFDNNFSNVKRYNSKNKNNYSLAA